MVKTIFLTNDEDQNSVACEMPTTLTVTYAVIVACVIETRTVFNPARSLIHHCSDPPAGLSSLAGNRAQVAAFRGRVLVRLLRTPVRQLRAPRPDDLGGTTNVTLLGFGTVFCSRQDKLKLYPGSLRSRVYRIPKTTAYASEF